MILGHATVIVVIIIIITTGAVKVELLQLQIQQALDRQQKLQLFSLIT